MTAQDYEAAGLIEACQTIADADIVVPFVEALAEQAARLFADEVREYVGLLYRPTGCAPLADDINAAIQRWVESIADAAANMARHRLAVPETFEAAFDARLSATLAREFRIDGPAAREVVATRLKDATVEF